uniref:glycine--tRNA ligase n=1 Tax=Quercus lobata TaxID=97700 RepID=A0A7N2LE66_QUELO
MIKEMLQSLCCDFGKARIHCSLVSVIIEMSLYTGAAEGFCRRYSIPLDSLNRKIDGKTEYLYARIMESARLAVEVLSEELPSTIAKISFPKSMRWNSQIMFSKPICWILALYRDVVVPFMFARVLSGNLSYGLRNTPSATLIVESAESYAKVMMNAVINVEIEERKKKILEQSNVLAKSVNGHTLFKEGLLDEVVNLVEAPVPVLGKFKESFLELPKDLLTMVMQKHQKYFAISDDTGRLLPYFIAVANGAIDETVVRKGNEAVLRSKFRSLCYFKAISYCESCRHKEKLGTMLDKMTRIQNMVTKLSLALQIDEDMHQVLQVAASLAMSDLATVVVTEFTSLSGIMARHYAIRDGYPEQVAEALYEITLPRFSGDILPATDAGLDSLVGLFAAGCQPSSTNDPFGLRRISYGLVQLLVEKDKNLDLKQALELAAEVQTIQVDASTIEDVDKGISSEVVRSILAERANLPSLAAKSANKMASLSRGNLFPKVVEAYSRPTRIVRGKEVDPDMEIMFSRPIRWILALHGDVVVPFMFAGVLSGNLSYGLRNTPSATLMVESAESYAKVMRNAGINVEIEERKKKILEHSNVLAKSVNGHILFKEGLLDEVVNLVEAPVPVLGKFKESFLELPKDLLTMVMQKHQKYFAISDDTGRLLPYFIAVANGAIDETVVRKGNEAVLRARYEDAKFFYEMDTRKKISEFRSKLKGILFHEKLGTMLDKMTRIQNMVTKLGSALQIDEDMLQVLQVAASLAMSDLATAVVTEFTSLAGIMARHYAIRDGYPEQVAEALYEITLPRFSGDILPATDAGIVLAIADRLDSLVGLFAAGCQPSSTNDPFGLRRISYGLVQLLVEKDKNLDLKQALELAAEVQPIQVDASTIEDVDKGISSEVVRSILAERANLPSLAAKSANKMASLSRGNLFPKVVEAYSRPTRIVRGKEVDPDMEFVNESCLFSLYLIPNSEGLDRTNRRLTSYGQFDVCSYCDALRGTREMTFPWKKYLVQKMLQKGKHFCLGRSMGDILTSDNLNKNEITLVIDVACAEAMLNPKSVVELLSGCGGIGLVDEAAFETNEERALWSAFLSVKNKIHPGIEIDDFVEISSQLVQPLEEFFNHVFVMVVELRDSQLCSRSIVMHMQGLLTRQFISFSFHRFYDTMLVPVTYHMLQDNFFIS